VEGQFENSLLVRHPASDQEVLGYQNLGGSPSPPILWADKNGGMAISNDFISVNKSILTHHDGVRD